MHTDSSLTTLSAADKRIQQLGAVMLRLEQETGAAPRNLLRAEGFSNHEPDTFGDAAANHARELSQQRQATRGEGFTKTDEEIVAIAVDAGLGLVSEAQIVTAALGRGLTPAQLARNWLKITRQIGLRIGTMPMPKVA